jgi:SAM-dependent methyltransferase
MRVLDVGCGPGTVTLDVANAIAPGSVVGIDMGEGTLEQARLNKQQSGVSNVEFEMGDAYALLFQEAEFDLTYSHALLEWLREPSRALLEQKRVTRSGGWVIAAVSSTAERTFYPDCPNLQASLRACEALADPSSQGIFIDPYCIRKAVAAFKRAGFDELEVQAYGAPHECAWPGSEFFEFRYHHFKRSFTVEGNPIWQRLLELGACDEATLEQASRELDEWHAHPHAFYVQTRLLVAAQNL